MVLENIYKVFMKSEYKFSKILSSNEKEQLINLLVTLLK
jgi:hypothetical protein